jgi:hypothetical protein
MPKLTIATHRRREIPDITERRGQEEGTRIPDLPKPGRRGHADLFEAGLHGP